MLKAINIKKPTEKPRLSGMNLAGLRRILGKDDAKSPLLVLSRSAVRRNLKSLAAALPGVGIRYAVKSNDHPAILEEVARVGHSFDIASAEELHRAVRAGGNVESFIHSHPIKPIREIEESINAGAALFVVDNPDEIEKFIPFADKVRLLIRFSVENSSAVVNLSYKFGCHPKEIIHLAEKIRESGLKLHGLTFHVGSQCLDSSIYVKAVETAGEAIKKLQNRGFKIGMLDIGGGYPVPYTHDIPRIKEFCRPIRNSLKKNIPANIEIICEPGRFISATAVTLFTTVIGKSKRGGKYWYFLDDGLYGSFSGRMYDHGIYQVLTNRNTTWKRSVLAGPTCDSIDVIYKDILLPPLEIGDQLAFPAMGAYCSVSASTFNSIRKAEYVVIQ